MTVLVAVRSRSAVVIGSDSEERSTTIRRRTTKIFVPQAGLVLAWAGYKDVAQAMALSLQEKPLELTLARSQVEEKPLELTLARSQVAEAARERFRTIRADPDVEHRSEVNEFMLGWYCEAEHKPVGLHLQSGSGSGVWVEQMAVRRQSQRCLHGPGRRGGDHLRRDGESGR